MKSVNNKVSRIGNLSLITLMALSLSVGKVRAAEDFKLWHDVVGGEGKALTHLDQDTDKANAVKWLVTDVSKESVEKFVKATADEPFKFVEGLKEARAKAEKDEKFNKDWIADLSGRLFGTQIKPELFGDNDEVNAFRSLFTKLMSMEKVDDAFLKTLFNKKSTLAALSLTDKKPGEKEVEKPKPVVTPTPVVPPIPKVGEVDDSVLQRQAQQVCDKFNGLREESAKALNDQINPLKDALNETFNKLADLSTAANPNAVANKRNEKGLEEILPGLLANAVKDDKQQEITPASNQQQPFFPQQQNNRRDNTDPNALNQPLPQQDQPQQQASMPFMPSYSPGVTTPVKLDLPTASGRVELRDAQDALSAVQTRQPVAASIGMNAGLPDLVMAKVKVRTDIQKAQSALLAAKDRASRLDEQLEELKEGGRAALSPDVKRRQAQLQQDVQTKKSQLDQQRQMMQMLAPEQRDQVMQSMYMQQQQVTQAETALNQYNSEVEIAVEQGNAKIKSLAKVRDNLQSVATKLESEVAGMKEDETAVQQLINQNMQMQAGQIQPQQQGTPNVNRLQGFSGGNGAPRTTPPSRLGAALTSGTKASSTEQRGSLGSK